MKKIDTKEDKNMQKRNRKIRNTLLVFAVCIVVGMSGVCMHLYKVSTKVPDEGTPLGCNYKTYSAEFYINTTGQTYADRWYFMCKDVGGGCLLKPRILYSKPDEVEKILGVVPNVSMWTTQSRDIEWVTVTYALGKYRVIGRLVEKEVAEEECEEVQNDTSLYSSLEEMKAGQLKEGDYVKTAGYYAANDGGAANYLITGGGKTADNCMVVELENGLQAELQVQNGTVVAEQFGAYGDGIHDDVAVLQKIIDKGYNLELTEGKTYKLISNGIYISNSVTIIGNGATILVDDTYAPQKSDFNYYCIRYQYGNQQDYFGINKLNLEINFSDGRISGREFVGVSPLYIDTVNLDGLNVTTNQSNNCIICVWLDRGCSSFTLKNSRLENNTNGATGGALWMTAKDDEVFTKFNDIKYSMIKNTTLSSSSADEVIALWGTNQLNAIFEECTIKGAIRAVGHTRPIAIYSEGNWGAVLDVRFTDCIISAESNETNSDSFYDSLMGVGSNYPSNTLSVNFENCKIDSDVNGALIFPSGYASDQSQIASFDSNNPSVQINFTNCDVVATHPITGSSMSYYNTAVLYPSAAWNCSFKKCDITCGTAFAYLYMPWSKNYFVPQISLESCKVEVSNAKDFICKGDRSALIDLEINGTQIQAETVEEILSEQTNVQSAITAQKNAVNKIVVTNSYLNSKKILE